MKSVVSERGQITVPKEVRDRLGLVSGTELEFELVRGGFVARKRVERSPWDDVYGVLGQGGSSDEAVTELRGEVDAVE